jgi:hypothetical protein
MMDLSVIVSILFECIMEEFNFFWDTSLVADGSS